MHIIRGESAGEQVLHFRKYFYRPSMPAAIIFVILFGAAAILHVHQMVRTRTWFMIPFVLGAACEFTSRLTDQSCFDTLLTYRA